MTLHIFNPEHDIALAANLSNFTAPHAGRQLRHDLGWLPAIWADPDDAVLVDDVVFAETAYTIFCRHCLKRLAGSRIPVFVDRKKVARLPLTDVAPWGWDCALHAQLLRFGCSEMRLPTEEQLADIRSLSHRQQSHSLLQQLRLPGTVGESHVCKDVREIEELQSRYRRLVLKAPWSSSGRGVRFIDTDRNTLQMQSGWIGNVLHAQGSVMAEPYYNKVKDLGMEFNIQADGKVCFEGLSLFHTKNGAYMGNVLATENAKREQLSRYISLSLLDEVATRICNEASVMFGGRYSGSFGVDMMIVNGTEGCYLHPCVEVNLRCTMGHVALKLARLVNPTGDNEVLHVMRIELSNRYLLKINKL